MVLRNLRSTREEAHQGRAGMPGCQVREAGRDQYTYAVSRYLQVWMVTIWRALMRDLPLARALPLVLEDLALAPALVQAPQMDQVLPWVQVPSWVQAPPLLQAPS